MFRPIAKVIMSIMGMKASRTAIGRVRIGTIADLTCKRKATISAPVTTSSSTKLSLAVAIDS